MVRLRMRAVSTREEREFERTNVSSKLDEYLATSPVERYEFDEAYSRKIDRIAADLTRLLPDLQRRVVLDIGGNTAGESTLLARQGLNMIVGDINEEALRISQLRCQKFQLIAPKYVGLDVADLPFVDQSLDAVMVIEALHHFVDYDRALAEIHRVLKPGGLLYSLEPNGMNPLRRISEVRDRLRGTIEKSFFKSQIRRLLATAGYEDVEVLPYGSRKSSWKLSQVPAYRRFIAIFHGWLSSTWPRLFGSHVIVGRKRGCLEPARADASLTEILADPIEHSPVELDAGRWYTASRRYSYPSIDGIPVLIAEDAVLENSRRETSPRHRRASSQEQ
jgi:ubiquinone/menaquinone biosynthesis C-methylase UbiE/uncharacterized protein YbaR (Trm112 family)